MFSKKATKNDQIFTADLTLCKCQIDGEDFVNFCGLRKHELYWVFFKKKLFIFGYLFWFTWRNKCLGQEEIKTRLGLTVMYSVLWDSQETLQKQYQQNLSFLQSQWDNSAIK